MKDILDNWSKAITVLVFALLMVTLVRDWGYFLVIGPELQSLQTPFDYLSNSVQWLPQNFLLLAITTVVAVCASFLVFGKENDLDFFEGVEPKALRRKNIRISLLFAAILFSLMGVVFYETAGDLGITITLVSLSVLSSCLVAIRVLRLSRSIRRSLFLGLSIALGMLWAFSFGNGDAYIATKARNNVHNLVFKDGRTLNIALLRTLDKGVIVWMPATSRAALVRWDQIESISRFVNLTHESLSCKMLALGCVRPVVVP
ncbi:hypothetical protein AB8A05_10895 [Tardiphaga sp. 538_B7_N1_4]|uniref:hypothetical protein n=1 Tax=Tardiphaga sp. 538_B7_N1_4 TaxID=3240778 RepID=UPI003F21A509